MSTLAKGVSLSLGLIQTTVKVVGAKRTPESLKTLCIGPEDKRHAPSPIRQTVMCPTCTTDTHAENLRKGRAQGDGFIVVEEDEVKSLHEEEAKFKGTIGLTPHPAEQVYATTAQGDKMYYLVPDGDGSRYALLLALVEKHPELAFANLYTVRSRAAMYVLRAKDGALFLEERCRDEHILPAPEVDATVDPALLGMAEQALPLMVKDYDPATYADTYTAALNDLMASREAVPGGQQLTIAPTTPKASDTDLMAQLAAMVAPKPEPRRAAKKAAAPRRKAS